MGIAYKKHKTQDTDRPGERHGRAWNAETADYHSDYLCSVRMVRLNQDELSQKCQTSAEV